MRRDEGVPPYRRLRRESDTMSFRALAKKFPCGKNGTLHIRDSPLASAGSAPKNPPHKKRHKTYPRRPTCPQWLTVEKSPAIETKISYTHYPKHLPAGAPCRASPLARRGSLPLRCGGSPFLFPHGGGSRRKPRFESVVKRGGVAVTDDFGNLFDRIIGTAEQSRGVIEFRVAHDVGKSFSE